MAGKDSVSHPYFPRDIKIPHYVPNDMSLVELLGWFFGALAVLVVATWVYSGKSKKPKFSVLQKSKLCWFMACALIHIGLEGYFSVQHVTIAGEMSYLAQLWKEYAKGDSRYMIGDPFTVCMETITAFFDGPLCLLALYAFLKNKSYRYVVQLILSVCQLYGDVLYFSTEFKEGFTHGPMGHALYFWFYFVFMNGIWIVIPSILIVESMQYLSAAQSYRDSKEGSKKIN